MAPLSQKEKKLSISTLADKFSQVDHRRIACFEEPKLGSSGSVSVVFVEFHGNRVDDVRTLRSKMQKSLKEAGINASIEIVRAGWLPQNSSGKICLGEIASRYETAIAKKKRSTIEDGSFSVLPDTEKDCFDYFGNFSKIRTPCEITYPSHITIGNWVSFGRYGKIVMLPDEVFSGDISALACQHYGELSKEFDFSKWVTGRPAKLYVGDGTSLGDRYFIICTCSVEFGQHVMTASDLFISDCHHIFENTELPPVLLPPTKGKPVRIGDHVWIGLRCSILEGVTIGRHAVVAAHSVVKEDVPPYSLAAGSPAKVKKHFAPKQKHNKHENKNY